MLELGEHSLDATQAWLPVSEARPTTRPPILFIDPNPARLDSSEMILNLEFISTYSKLQFVFNSSPQRFSKFRLWTTSHQILHKLSNYASIFLFPIHSQSFISKSALVWSSLYNLRQISATGEMLQGLEFFMKWSSSKHDATCIIQAQCKWSRWNLTWGTFSEAEEADRHAWAAPNVHSPANDPQAGSRTGGDD